ncbi:MAG: type IV pili methyl-accepting chemotaxis transducer N-terminal domain-containing protein [Rhodoferax sp.]|nr:type IV pili methyl-accepting chemotaxis transducer N-terminal domain-containing protein [Rhodoferax sp.]
MNLNRRIFISLAATSVLILPSQAQVSDLNDAINKAGRQRMLSQRMAKAYLCLGQQVQIQGATKALDQSMALFDRQLAELKSYAPQGAVRDTYLQLEAEWLGYKALLVGAAPSAASAGRLLAQDGKVLALAHQGTTQLEQLSGKPLGKLVNMAGRQRMLSQRMAKYYLAMAWKVETATAEAELGRARSEFIAAQQTLRNAPEATPEIKQELALADGQWVFFEAALQARANSGNRGVSEVFIASENLLQVMDKVTNLYARINRA